MWRITIPAVLVILVIPSAARAAATVEQNTSSFNYGAGISQPITVTSTTAGHLLILHMFNNDSRTISTITDNIGTNVYVEATGSAASNGTERWHTYYCLSTSAGVTTITVTWSGASATFDKVIGYRRISGLGTAEFDIAGNSSGSTSGNAVLGPSITTTSTDGFISAAAAANGGITANPAAGNECSSSGFLIDGYFGIVALISTTAAAHQCNWTNASDGAYVATAAAFKAGAGGDPPSGNITYIGGCAAATTACTPSTHAVGDLFLAYAGRNGNATAPALPSGWTNVGTASINGTGSADSSARFACKVATTASETATGFTNAGTLIVHIYRGQLAGLTAVCASSILGTPSFFTTTVNTTSTTETFNSITSTENAYSWVVGFGYAPAATAGMDTAPSGMTNRSVQGTIEGGHDTNAGVSSFSSANVTITTASRIITVTAEIKAEPVAGGPAVVPAQRGAAWMGF